jgi:flavin-dependent dehydrogenase
VDVIVVGGGPAGAAGATLLGRAGLRVLLLERGVRSGAKVCGEGVLPPGIGVLRELGVLAALEQGPGARIAGIRWVTEGGTAADGRFPAGLRGIAVPRTALDSALFDVAAGTPGVEARRGSSVRGLELDAGRVAGVRTEAGVLRATAVVAADGLGSIAHRAPGVRCTRPRRRRLGMRAHWRGVAGMGDRVEVLLGDGFELYLAPQGRGLTLLAALVDGAPAGGAAEVARTYRELVARHPALGVRMASAELADEPRALGPLGLTVRGAPPPGLFLLGDAAGALDPITGEGISLALRSARDLAELLPRALSDEAELARAGVELAARRAARVRDLERLTAFVLTLARHPRLAERAVAALARSPRVLERLLAVACGTAPWSAIRLRDKARLALAVGRGA